VSEEKGEPGDDRERKTKRETDGGTPLTALESALAFWDLIMPSSPTYGDAPNKFSPRQLELWKTFLSEKGNGRAVSKDTWMLVST
jgi:hypothetical protein